MNEHGDIPQPDADGNRSFISAVLWSAAAVLSIAVTVAVAIAVGRPKPLALSPEIAGGKVGDLDVERIREHVRALTRTPSRLTGYPGSEQAAEYILAQLRGMGVDDVYVQPFRTPVPIVETAELRARTAAGDVRISLHPVWPNLARTSHTPPEGITGPLVDLGSGSDAEIAGKKIRGSIAVMDWGSRNEWLFAPEFGAKAVLFRADPHGDSSTARAKFLTVPGNVPRFYVAREDLPVLDALLRDAARPSVTVHCVMYWKDVETVNILARVPTKVTGTGDDASAVVFQAPIDSISVTPDLAPGAEQAISAATLLELVRYLQNREFPHAVYVLFTGGHGQAFAGMTAFVRMLRDAADSGLPKELAGATVERLGTPGLVVSLDLSSHSDRFGVFCCGRFRGQYEGHLRPRFSTLGLKLANYARELEGRADKPASVGDQFVDCINLTLGRGWWTYFPYQAPFESELATVSGIPGISLSTINDARQVVDTPDDTFAALDFDLFSRQVLHVPGKRVGLANICLALVTWKGPYVSRPLENHLARLRGRVVWLDQERNYVPNEPLKNAVVFLKTQRGDKYLLGTRGLPVAMTDDDGRFEFDGLIESKENWQFENCLLEAYGLADRTFIQSNPEAVREYRKVRTARGENPELMLDGSVFYAVDMAREREYPWQVRIRKLEQHLNLVCFPARAVTLFGLTDPREYVDLKDVQILDASTESPPFQYGHSSTDAFWGNPEENCVTVWADPSLRVRITLGFGFQKKRLILINNSPEDPIGAGFKLEDLRTIPSMLLQGASDMWNLDDWRLNKLRVQGIRNPRVEKLHAEARTHLETARAALRQHDYRTYRSAGERAWALEGKAYEELLSMTNNMIRGVLFYLALLLPFAYCLERLLFAFSTIQRRIAGTAGIFVAGFAVLALVHPAFRFTMTPLIVLLAFVILALGGTVITLVIARFDAALRERKQALTGFHEEDAHVGNIAVRAVDLGIANIRRRKQRGILTGMTIVAVMFTLLSFVSIVPELNISRLRHPDGVPAPQRLLARDRRWMPMRWPALDSLRRTFEASETHAARGVVAARGWFFSDYSGNLSQIDVTLPPEARVHSAAGSASPPIFTAVALLCMEPAEAQVTGVEKTLVAGRWFRKKDERAVILPRHVADCLGLDENDLGTPLLIFGQRLPLIGIIDEDKFDRIRDIDGEPLTPVNFVLQMQMMAERASAEEKADTLENYVHYPADQVVIVSFGFGRNIGATLRSIGIRTFKGVAPVEQAEAFARRSNQTILASDGREVLLFASVAGSKLSAAGQVIVPIVLGFLMVLGTMLGSVYERKREIFVYNSVGLSPSHVAWLFLAESSVYAVVGASLGYLLGQIVSKVLLMTGSLSGLSLNYSAGSTVFVTILTMSIVLLSTIYPARQAFLAAIPESRAEGAALSEEQFAADQIACFLPFVAIPANIYAMQVYMWEYFDSIQGVTVGRLGIDNLSAALETQNGRPCPVLRFRAWLAPFDLGISHDVELRVIYRPERDVFQYHVTAVHFSGDHHSWRRLAPNFLLTLRKQLLMWRILPPEMQESYRREGRKLFGVDDAGASAETGALTAADPDPSAAG